MVVIIIAGAELPAAAELVKQVEALVPGVQTHLPAGPHTVTVTSDQVEAMVPAAPLTPTAERPRRKRVRLPLDRTGQAESV